MLKPDVHWSVHLQVLKTLEGHPELILQTIQVKHQCCSSQAPIWSGCNPILAPPMCTVDIDGAHAGCSSTIWCST